MIARKREIMTRLNEIDARQTEIQNTPAYRTVKAGQAALKAEMLDLTRESISLKNERPTLTPNEQKDIQSQAYETRIRQHRVDTNRYELISKTPKQHRAIALERLPTEHVTETGLSDKGYEHLKAMQSDIQTHDKDRITTTQRALHLQQNQYEAAVKRKDMKSANQLRDIIARRNPDDLETLSPLPTEQEQDQDQEGKNDVSDTL